MNSNNIFDILECRNNRGYYPLNENHWSNILAWLLSQETIRHSLLALLIPSTEMLQWTVEREVAYDTGSRKRLIDVHLATQVGVRCFIEVKIDPDYQDSEQIVDQISLLRSHERYVIVAPLDLNSTLSTLSIKSNSGPKVNAVTWRSIAEWCRDTLSSFDSLEPMEQTIIQGIESYWTQTAKTPFEQLVRSILEAEKWSSFYPDDFKEAFLHHFPEVWASWVETKPVEGNGNPHQYLLTCLSMLANRKNGFRLVRTGRSRPPRPLDWGYPKIHELSFPGSETHEVSE